MRLPGASHERSPGRHRHLVVRNCSTHRTAGESRATHRVQPPIGLTVGYPHPGRLPDEVVDAYYGPVFGTPESSRAFARLTTAISSEDLAAVRPQLAQLKVPTLIVWGTGDLFFPLKWARRLADLIPGTTTIAKLDGARMHFPDHRADEFVPLLQQHWAQNGW